MVKIESVNKNLSNIDYDNPISLKIPQVKESSDNDLMIEHIFDAPKDLIYKMFTEAEHLKNWFGNQLSTVTDCEVDLRLGGKISFIMKDPNGLLLTLEGIFYKIEENQKLIFSTGAFKESEGKQAVEFLNTVTFDSYGEKTKLTLQSQVIKAKTEKSIFAIQGMHEGWTSSMEKLENYIKIILIQLKDD